MRSYFSKYKIIVPILSISIIYNLLWFTLFLFLIFEFSDYRFTFTVGFLIFYLSIAEPLKDYFIHLIFFKPLYPTPETKSFEDRRIKELSKRSQIPKLLKTLGKDMGINQLTMIVQNHRIHQSDFLLDGNQVVKKVEGSDAGKIFEFLKLTIDRKPDEPASREVQAVYQKYEWKAALPIFSKNKFYGFLAFSENLEHKRKAVFESLAARIALLLENDALTESTIKNETFRKELKVARKIEKFLIEHKSLKIDDYSVVFHQKLKSDDDAPVLFENSLEDQNDSSHNFMIYTKIFRANKNKKSMLLFILSGYFLAFSREGKSLKKLAQLINEASYRNGVEFSSEGFLIEYAGSSAWRITCFGASIEAVADNMRLKLPKSSPMGSTSKKDFNIFSLRNKKEIRLNIFQNSELIIRKNEK